MQYQYELEGLYEENIGIPLDADRVWALYKWKNGTEKMAAKDQQSIRSVYIPELENLPPLKAIQDAQTYIESLSGGGIWDIFWLHCVNPDLFPIFDQHTYRSMAKIEDLSLSEIPAYRPKNIEVYLNQYIPFTKKFTMVSPRALGRALFAYGRFLKKGLSGKSMANKLLSI